MEAINIERFANIEALAFNLLIGSWLSFILQL